MKRLGLLVVVLSFLWVISTGRVTAMEGAKPAINQQFAQGLDDLARELRDWLGRWSEYFGSGALKPEERPLISFMLRNREKLELSAAQVKNLEQLRNDFEKESIRKDADLRVAEMDLSNLLGAAKIDMAKAEAKIREIERLRGDLRIARVRTIQKGKELLTADQRKKLQELLAEQQFARLH
ncbi:MAG TPA: periplasmic heavy metal sensor [Candidatus Binatia bacterium]|nr:periplasmic heavy metal sensor [Candidatus Binatia bacterium]